MLPSHFINTCLFSNSPFYNHPPSTYTRSLSLTFSLSLLYPVLVPPVPFWIKTNWILCLDYQLNKRFSIAHCSHFKGNINTKLCHCCWPNELPVGLPARRRTAGRPSSSSSSSSWPWRPQSLDISGRNPGRACTGFRTDPWLLPDCAWTDSPQKWIIN